VIIINSINGIPIRLTTERWGHIASRHPELDGQKDMVLETLTSPDFVQEGDFGELMAIRFYGKTPLTSKHLAVIYKETGESDGFLITAYYTSNPSERRKTVWKR
jgi:hypothetical protein